MPGGEKLFHVYCGRFLLAVGLSPNRGIASASPFFFRRFYRRMVRIPSRASDHSAARLPGGLMKLAPHRFHWGRGFRSYLMYRLSLEGGSLLPLGRFLRCCPESTVILRSSGLPEQGGFLSGVGPFARVVPSPNGEGVLEHATFFQCTGRAFPFPRGGSMKFELVLLPNVPFPRLFGDSPFLKFTCRRVSGRWHPGISAWALRIFRPPADDSTVSGRQPLFSVYRWAGVPLLTKFKPR